MEMKDVYFDFAADDIANGKYNFWELIQPLWFTVSIYDDIDVYNNDLKNFSDSQRKILAVIWYDSEVNNGGHDQFLFNSTGMVWKDAYEGLKLIGAVQLAENFKKVIDMFGGTVPFDRDERQEQSDKLCENEDFDDFRENDDFYYTCECEDVSELINDYIRNNPSEFVVRGTYQIADI